MRSKSAPDKRTDTLTEQDHPLSVVRIKARDLLKQRRDEDINHEGKIYRLRLTQTNKLISMAELLSGSLINRQRQQSRADRHDRMYLQQRIRQSDS